MALFVRPCAWYVREGQGERLSLSKFQYVYYQRNKRLNQDWGGYGFCAIMGRESQNGGEKMKSIIGLITFLCFLLYAPGQAEEERDDYGKVWNNWNAFYRYVYLWGFKDGMSEGWNDLERFFHRTLKKDWSPHMEKHMAYYRRSVSKNFPEIEEVRDVMTNLYANEVNAYLEPSIVFLASVAKIRGTPPEVIENLLATARKKSYQLHVMRKKKEITTEEVMRYIKGPSFSSMVYKEIYGEKE